MDNLPFFVFVIIYTYTTNWFQINAFVISLLKPKSSIQIINDRWIISVIKQKSGLDLQRIILLESEKLFGMMPSVPLWPELILSSGLYKTLNRDELEWVIIHEAGHCILWHTLKSVLVEAGVLAFGLVILTAFRTDGALAISVPLGVVFSLVSIRILWHFEYEADEYAISRVDNARGVITAQERLEKARNPSMNWFYVESSIFRKLLFWNILPSQRIAMARKRLHAKSRMNHLIHP